VPQKTIQTTYFKKSLIWIQVIYTWVDMDIIPCSDSFLKLKRIFILMIESTTQVEIR
jgi:hypothetical protein